MNFLSRLARCLILVVGLAAWGGTAHAACSNPAGEAGRIIYASNYNTFAFCNGNEWVSMAGWNNSSGGGAGFLNELSDVDTSGAATGSILSYNGSTWVVSDSAAGADNLGDHTATQALDMGAFNITNAGTVYGTGGAFGGLTVTGASSFTTVSTSLIQVGNTGAACTAGISGSIRYSSVSSTMEYCNSTAWVSMGPSDTVPVSFRVHRNGSDQSLTDNTETMVDWTAKEFDTNNNFDLASDRFTPTVPGMYLLTFQAHAGMLGDADYMKITIYKNGVLIASATPPRNATSDSTSSAMITIIVSANGSTDYFDTYVKTVIGSAGSLKGKAYETYFTGVLIGPQAGGGGGGGGAGVTALASLTDVSVAGATNGQVLTYSGGTWIASTTSGGSSALGDRITSGTHAVTVNTSSGYVSLSTGGTDWGYLSSGNSYLPTLIAGRVSSTNISGSLIQVGSGNSASCNASLKGAIRYSNTSSTLELCNGVDWGGIYTGGGSDLVAFVADQKSSGTDGGSYTAGSWVTRDLNTELFDNIGVTVASNQITLPAGTYDFDISVPAYRLDQTQTRLYNVTDGTVALHGMNGYARDDYAGHTFSAIKGRVTIGATKTFAVQLRAQGSRATNGLGVMSGFGTETYTVVSIRKVNSGGGGGGGASQLSDLTDVDTSGATAGSVIRYDGSNWVVSSSGAGMSALASLTDVQLTNLAGRDYLRYDYASSKWVNISESTVMSTTTMVAGWPDAIMCDVSGEGERTFIANVMPYTDGRYHYRQHTLGASVVFNANGSWYSGAYGTCNTASISSLYAAGRAFNFIGNAGTSGGGALGDRITSGTLAMVANSVTSIISLTTGTTDWGYLASNGSYLPRLNAPNISSTYVQLTSPSANIICANNISGTLRYSGGTVQVCNGSAWSSIVGAGALASLTDVQLTNLAGRDYLRYDSVAGKWVNISESVVMSTTTMVPNWPDAIICNVTSDGIGKAVFYRTYSTLYSGSPNYRAIATTPIDIYFNNDGSYRSHLNAATTDCMVSIDTLYAQGQAFNFIGNSGASDGNALGDRITSGTLAVTVNSATSIVSLSTNGTTWGYFGNAQSYLPRLTAPNISSTYVQLTSPSSNITCANNISGTLRYSGGTVQVCNGSAWSSIVGAGALASLTDVQLTNLAGRDYLRYDSVAGKWVNISESTVMSTTTMKSGWPDAIQCYGATGSVWLYLSYDATASNTVYVAGFTGTAATDNLRVSFNAGGTWTSVGNAGIWSGYYETNCNSAATTIASLFASGRAFNFIGNAATSGGSALGDRITSGTLAMVANSATSYISLSTAGTTWGYFASGGTYLPNLLTIGGNISATGSVSVTGSIQAQVYLHYSDRRLKDDITGIANAADILSKLRGTHFKWKSSGQFSYGLIAQEVEEVVPELVPSGGGMKSVAYDQVIPILIEGWKIHQKSIEGLQVANDNLLRAVDDLRREVSELKQAVNK